MAKSDRDELATALDDANLEREMDRLSLEQALRDFEIANARAVDLTKRLIEANQQIKDLTAQIERSHPVSKLKSALISFVKRTPFEGIARRIQGRLRSLAR